MSFCKQIRIHSKVEDSPAMLQRDTACIHVPRLRLATCLAE